MYTYEGNKMAMLCCDMLAKWRAPSTALYIYGPHGSGKSAMLDYIESELFINDESKTVLRMSAASITENRDTIYARVIQKGGDVDLFMIEDMQLVQTEDTVFYAVQSIVDAMNSKGKKVVITADRSLSEISEYRYPDFYNRMKWEMSVSVIKPSGEVCYKAFMDLVRASGNDKNSDIGKIFGIILDAEGANIGNILSTFRRIVVRAEYQKRKLTAEFAEEVIYDGVDIELIGA